jgi:hypothetical protein
MPSRPRMSSASVAGLVSERSRLWAISARGVEVPIRTNSVEPCVPHQSGFVDRQLIPKGLGTTLTNEMNHLKIAKKQLEPECCRGL